MKDITDKNFGVIIAFLLPGFLLIWGISFSSGAVSMWLAASEPRDAPTVAGFLYTTLASLSLGLLISAFRWLVIDHIFWCFNLRDSGLNFANLKDKDRYAAFSGVVENHYRYYQYYANTLVAVIAAFVFFLKKAAGSPPCGVWVLVSLVAAALFLGAMDALRKYYKRSEDILR